MDILLDNPLATMYGPYFLLLYGFVIAFTLIVLAIIKSQIDRTNKLNSPPVPSQIDPFEVAYLRGGINEVARSIVFSLMQKGFIELFTDSTAAEIRQTDKKEGAGKLSQIEQLALGWFYTPRQSFEVFQSSGLIEQLKPFEQTYQARLENQQMLVDDDMRGSLSMVKWTAYLIILGLGLYKMLAAILHGYYNIVFLIIFMIVGLLIAKAASRLPRVTKLGNAYLERLQLAFDNLKFQAQATYTPSANQAKVIPQSNFARGVDPLLLSVGIFGAGVLAGTVYEQYNQAFYKAQNHYSTSGSSSSCGSSCGTSCSTSSSDSGSSSSCSSGSSCGGGCGGCGGGGD